MTITGLIILLILLQILNVVLWIKAFEYLNKRQLRRQLEAQSNYFFKLERVLTKVFRK